MKKIIAICVLLFTIGVSMPEAKADFASHPRYAQIVSKIDALMASIDAAEAAYFSVNDKYFQGILAPNFAVDGMTDVAVNWAVKPSDQLESWKEFAPTIFRNNTKVPFQIKIDVYQSQQGWGYFVTIEVWYDGLGPDQFGNYGSHWVYRHHVGPQQVDPTYLDTPFIMVEDL